MDAVHVVLFASALIRVTAILLGGGMVLLGYRLYLRGLRGRAGKLEAAWGERKFVLENGAPGTFLVLAGTVIVLTALITKPEFHGQYTGRRTTRERLPTGYRSIFDSTPATGINPAAQLPDSAMVVDIGISAGGAYSTGWFGE